MAEVEVIEILENELPEYPIVPGRIIFTYDGRIYWDSPANVRLQMAVITDLELESIRLNMVNPANKFYYVIETQQLWRYQNGVWKAVTLNLSFIGTDGKIDNSFLNIFDSAGKVRPEFLPDSLGDSGTDLSVLFQSDGKIKIDLLPIDNLPKATLSEYGVTILSNTITNDETKAATPTAVKAAKDYALNAKGLTSGSGTNYTLSDPSFELVDGATIRFKLHVISEPASSINVNLSGAKQLKDSSGGNMKAGKPPGTWLTAIYSSDLDSFILQGEGGGGGEVSGSSSDLLEGIVMNDAYGNAIIGSMPDRGSINKTITSQNAQVYIEEGYHNGSGTVKAVLPDLGAATKTLTLQNETFNIPSGYRGSAGTVKADISNLTAQNVRTGVNVGGVSGVFTSDATAASDHILASETAYVNGLKVTGIMPNHPNQTRMIYAQGAQIQIEQGYHRGGGVVRATFPNLEPENIKLGVNVGGVIGTLGGGQIATGFAVLGGDPYGDLIFPAINVGFRPKIFVAWGYDIPGLGSQPAAYYPPHFMFVDDPITKFYSTNFESTFGQIYGFLPNMGAYGPGFLNYPRVLDFNMFTATGVKAHRFYEATASAVFDGMKIAYIAIS